MNWAFFIDVFLLTLFEGDEKYLPIFFLSTITAIFNKKAPDFLGAILRFFDQ